MDPALVTERTRVAARGAGLIECGDQAATHLAPMSYRSNSCMSCWKESVA